MAARQGVVPPATAAAATAAAIATAIALPAFQAPPPLSQPPSSQLLPHQGPLHSPRQPPFLVLPPQITCTRGAAAVSPLALWRNTYSVTAGVAGGGTERCSTLGVAAAAVAELQLLETELEAGPPFVAFSEAQCPAQLVPCSLSIRRLVLETVEQTPSRSHLVQGQKVATESTLDISLQSVLQEALPAPAFSLDENSPPVP